MRLKTLTVSLLLLMAAATACTTVSSDDSSSPTTVASTAIETQDSDTQSSTTTTSEASSATSGEVITDMIAPAADGGSGFDGTVNEIADLEDLVQAAWGNGQLGLHRGHQQIENVLIAFLGISHDEMHVYMEEQGMNLAAVVEELGLDPENLIESLTNSFSFYVEEGVEQGVIDDSEAVEWLEQIRQAFADRVYWEG